MRKNDIRIKWILLMCLMVLASCSSTAEHSSPAVEIEGIDISVEIVDTPTARSKGLMYRESLCETCGMWFEFEESGFYPFWMKNTLIPLDIIWIDETFTIVDIHRADPCTSPSCQNYVPMGDAKYVLEVHQGFSVKNSINIGDTVRFKN